MGGMGGMGESNEAERIVREREKTGKLIERSTLAQSRVEVKDISLVDYINVQHAVYLRAFPRIPSFQNPSTEPEQPS
jgi:hypothetical protein